MLLQKCGEAVELLGPEPLVTIEPLHRLLHRGGGEFACDLAPRFAARDQAGIRENVEMLHDRGQRHVEWFGQFADGNAVLFVEAGEERAPRRVSERAEHAVESGILGDVLILNHGVKY